MDDGAALFQMEDRRAAVSGTIAISSLSTEMILIPVSATFSGSPHNPTSDVVQFAFTPGLTSSPQISDWVSGSWDTAQNAIYPYIAQCLVGPSGVKTLTAGEYSVWIKITDNPEIIVQQVGILVVN